MIRANNLIVTFFNIGHSKYLPGSLASLISGFLIYIFLIKTNPSATAQALLLFVLIVGSFLSINEYQKGSSKKDPREVVIDEVVGMYISLMFLNIIKASSHSSLISSEIDYFLLAFILFRLFDGFKPSFLYRIQILESNPSILLDDIFAGLLTFLLMLVLALNGLI